MEAVELARQQHPELILMDIQMPLIDGIEAIKRLRAEPAFAATPIVAMTALAMVGDRERCLAAGATEYVSKPLVMEELADLVDRLLQGAV